MNQGVTSSKDTEEGLAILKAIKHQSDRYLPQRFRPLVSSTPYITEVIILQLWTQLERMK